MTLWQKFTGILRSPVLAVTIMLSATAPSLAGVSAAQRVALVEEVKGEVTGVESLVEIGVLPRCFPGPAVDKIRAAAGEKYTFHKLPFLREG